MKKGLNKKLIVGRLVAGGLMVGAAALVIGAGIAKADYGSNTHEYLWLVREDTDAAPVWGFSDAWLVREGYGACGMMRQGYSHPAVMSGIRFDAGLPYSTNADVSIIAAAETALCSDQSSAPVAPSSPPYTGQGEVA